MVVYAMYLSKAARFVRVDRDGCAPRAVAERWAGPLPGAQAKASLVKKVAWALLDRGPLE